MVKIILITFAFMAFAFYELSGGDDFVSIADEKRTVLAAERAQEERILAAAKAERTVTVPAVSQATPSVVVASAVVLLDEPKPETAAAVTLALDETKAEDVTASVTADVAQAEITEPPAIAVDLREVTAARVNMRDGPGQNFGVIAKLTNGEQVEILQDPGDGWVKLRVADTGRVGWMADFLLTASNN